MASNQENSKGNGTLDPVCGKWLPPEHRKDISADYKKRRYYFCSEKCRATFHRQTERFRVRELARAGSLFSPAAIRWGLA